MYRKELKYLINRQQQKVIENRLRLICQYDHYARTNGKYTVSSLYFDDYANSAFEDKLAGVIRRKKFRIRVYNRSDRLIKLERKTKHVNAIKKDYTVITREDYHNILSGSYVDFKQTNDPVKNDFVLSQKTKRLQPKVVVTYDRTAYVFPYGNVRIVFDSNLRTAVGKKDLFAPTSSVVLTEKDQVVMEIKYTGFLPDIIKKTVQHGKGDQKAFSKFVSCMSFHY